MDSKKLERFKRLTLVIFLPMMITTGTFVAIYFSLLPFSHVALGQEQDVLPKTGSQQIIQQGIVTSSPDPLPGHQAHQSITILRLREDNAVYSGTITFTTTRPVEVQILHRDMTKAGSQQSSMPGISEKFGKLTILQLPGGNGQVTISNVVPKFTEGITVTTYAASVPFSGNAVALHNSEGKPFAASYTVTADVLGAAKRVDEIEATQAQK
jgi:hypothetical protein